MAEQKREQLRKKLAEKKKLTVANSQTPVQEVSNKIVNDLVEIRKEIELILKNFSLSTSPLESTLNKFKILLKNLLSICKEIWPKDIQAEYTSSADTPFKEATNLIRNILEYSAEWITHTGMELYEKNKFQEAINIYNYYLDLNKICSDRNINIYQAKSYLFDITNRINLCYVSLNETDTAFSFWQDSKIIYQEASKAHINLNEQSMNSYTGLALGLINLCYRTALFETSPDKIISVVQRAFDVIQHMKNIRPDLLVFNSAECVFYYYLQSAYLKKDDFDKSISYYKLFLPLVNKIIVNEKKEHLDIQYAQALIDCWKLFAADILAYFNLIQKSLISSESHNISFDKIKIILNIILIKECASEEISKQIIQIGVEIMTYLFEHEQISLLEAKVVYAKLFNLYENLINKSEIIESTLVEMFDKIYQLPIPKNSNQVIIKKTQNHDSLAVVAYKELTKGRFQFIAYNHPSGTLYTIAKNDPEKELYLTMLTEFLNTHLIVGSVIFDNDNIIIKGFDQIAVDKVKNFIPEFEKKYADAVKAKTIKPVEGELSSNLLEGTANQKKKLETSSKERKQIKFQQLIDNIQNRMEELAKEKQQRQQKKEKLPQQKIVREKPLVTVLNEQDMSLAKSNNNNSDKLADSVNLSSSAMISSKLGVYSQEADHRLGGIEYKKDTIKELKQEKLLVVDPLLQMAVHYRQILAGYQNEYRDVFSATNESPADLSKQPKNIDIVIYHHIIHLNLTQFFLAIMLHLVNQKKLVSNDLFWKDLRIQLAHADWGLIQLNKLTNLVCEFFPFQANELPKDLISFKLAVREVIQGIEPTYTSIDSCLAGLHNEFTYITSAMKVFNNDKTLIQRSYAKKMAYNLTAVETAVVESSFHIERIDCVIQSLVELGEIYARLRELIPDHGQRANALKLKNLEDLLVGCKDKFRNLAYHEVSMKIDEQFEKELLKGLFSLEDFSTLCLMALELAPQVIKIFANVQTKKIANVLDIDKIEDIYTKTKTTNFSNTM